MFRRLCPFATHRLLPGGVSLLSNATMRALRRPDLLSRLSCLKLDRRYPAVPPCFDNLRAGELRFGSGRWSAGLAPIRLSFSTGGHRPSQVPGMPPYTSALLADPGRAVLPKAFTGNPMLSPLTQTGRPQRSSNFRDSVTRLWCSLHTLRAALTERLRNARFRLVASLCRAGVATRWASVAFFLMLRFHGSQCTGLCLARREIRG